MRPALLARLLILPVLAWNVQCAAAFVLWPHAYAPGFALSGVPGAAAVRGMGILFLMWNVPYAVAAWNPLRWRVSLYEAAAMQAIGLVGESLLLAGLPGNEAALRAAVARFVAFDAAGLLLLLAAVALVARQKPERKPDGQNARISVQ